MARDRKKITTPGLKNPIPEKYMRDLIEFLEEKKYGTFNLIIQDGKIVGCDILEKKRVG